jgi:hypothetical protein
MIITFYNHETTNFCTCFYLDKFKTKCRGDTLKALTAVSKLPRYFQHAELREQPLNSRSFTRSCYGDALTGLNIV